MTTTDGVTVLNLGYVASAGTFASYLLQYPPGNYEAVFVPHAWNHFCFSFERGKESRTILAYNWKIRYISTHLICTYIHRTAYP